MKYVIIGGVAAGASFACRLRRLDEFAEIIIYEQSNFVSYANCGLPYYVSNVINDQKQLTLQSPESLKNRFNIDVFVNSKVIKIDKDKKQITILNLKNKNTFIDNYDKLIIATGANAIKIADNNKRIFELKNVEDSVKLKNAIIENNYKSAIVLGGGFIGLEIAENLKLSGLDVTLIEGSNHVLANLDYEMACFVHNEIRKNNIKLLLNSFVNKVNTLNDSVEVYLKNNKVIKGDILIQAIGVRPNSELAKDAKLDLSLKDSIKVDNLFITSDKDIYAVGDVSAIKSIIDGEINYVPLAGIANKEGRFLADNLILNKSEEVKSNSTSILKVFDLSVASTGYNEEALKRKNINYDKIYLFPNNHASYYPNYATLNIKVLYNKDNYDILGAQIIGKEGVDKRIDILSMAIRYHINGLSLKDAELSYAPPFGSAKDPINMIGFMLNNLKDNLVRQFYLEDLDKIIKDKNAILLDVRDDYEYKHGHIHTSINIPLDSLRKNLNKLDKNKTYYLICYSALRSYYAYRILSQYGFDCYHLAGGFRLYNAVKKRFRFIGDNKYE
ncbi:MAG: FAD-dependent oxidoreductase [Firmicutes bacterium]|nr:FAD-dependent oxidoreductase [Candidatus Alectryobacillus merdavium]